MNGSPINRTVKKHHSQIPVNFSQQFPIRSLHQGLIIANRFKLIEKIGQGSFGSIFKTENIETNDVCATKFEKREDSNGGLSLLVREIKVLLELKGTFGFPQISFYGRDEHYNYFMINYLGYNFESLLRKCGGKFSLMATLQLASQILNRIELFHSKNFIHRDIKPENFVIGHNDIAMLFMIDFGLSKYYKDSQGKHIPLVDKKGIIGTARYASINAHLGCEQSRRDDLEGIGYVLIYFAKGKLPWMNIQIEAKQEKYNKILEYKQQTTIDALCENLPKCFFLYFQHVKNLQFTDNPNYSYLKNLFSQAIVELEKTEKFVGFDWEKLPEFKGKKGSSKSKDNKELREPPNQLNQPSSSTLFISQGKNINNKSQKKDKDSKLDINSPEKLDMKLNSAGTKRQSKEKLTLLNPDNVRSNAFLQVPLKDSNNQNNLNNSPIKGQRSIAESRAISIDTSRFNNYQMSNLNFQNLMKEETQEKVQNQLKNQLLPQKSIKQRKDIKALTISNPKGTPFIREAIQVNSEFVVEDQFLDYDNIHEMADDDDPHISIQAFPINQMRRINSRNISPE